MELFKNSGHYFVWNSGQNVGWNSCRNSGQEIRWPCLILYFECRHNNVNDLQMCTQTSFLFFGNNSGTRLLRVRPFVYIFLHYWLLRPRKYIIGQTIDL